MVSSSAIQCQVKCRCVIENHLSQIGYRGVLRDHDGRFICLFSSPIPSMKINHAEIYAIHRAIKISSSIDSLSQSRITMESDSCNAIKWCNGEACGPWNLSFVINGIRGAMRRGIGIEIVFKNRESNVVADFFFETGTNS